MSSTAPPTTTEPSTAPSAAPAALVNGLTAEERFRLLLSVGEECIAPEELQRMVQNKPSIRCYDGFEPSGRLHIAQGIFKAINVNKCTTAGCVFTFWVADWFALMNDKMGGELERIRTVGEYLIEVWSAAGMDMKNVEFLWSSQEINSNAKDYWKRVLDIGRRNTLARIKKCCQIMGRKEGSLTAAQILYPLMQCSDIFYLKADICQLGCDQRKVNMLAREYCDAIGKKLKPVILSHHMLAGLGAGQAKMSKSDPESAIFMEDTAEDVERKIMKAYCPKVVLAKDTVNEDGSVTPNLEKNPCLDYVQNLVFGQPHPKFVACGKSYETYKEVEEAFLSGALTEEGLKRGLIDALNALLDPVRGHFASSAKAKALLEKIHAYRNAPPPAKKEAQAAESSTHPCAVVAIPCKTRVPLSTALACVSRIRSFLELSPDATCILLQKDWSAFSANDCGGQEKDIDAVLEYNARLLSRCFSLPSQKLKIVKESELILSNPNEYWLTVIAAGRFFPLSSVEEAFEATPSAGGVVSALMHAADMKLLKASHCISLGDSKLNRLACKFCGELVAEAAPDPLPALPLLCNPATAATSPSGDDDTLYVDDTDMDIRRKVKRAYAAEKEVANPIVMIAERTIREMRVFSVKRSDANGGNKDYATAEELHSDCAQGLLHPADAKAAVNDTLLQLTAAVRAEVATPEMKKLAQALRNAEKRANKK